MRFCKTNAQIAKELKITPIVGKLLEYKRSWIQHVSRLPRNILPRVMKYYSPTGRRNHGRSLKRILDTWDRNASTSGPAPSQIYDYDDNAIHKVRWCSNGKFWNKYFSLSFGEYIYLMKFYRGSHFKQNHSVSLHSNLYYSHSLPENIKAYTIGPLSYRAVVIRLKLRGYDQTTLL